jgi:adenylyltransferase/sulfurtransferase
MEGYISVFDYNEDSPYYRYISRLFSAQNLSFMGIGITALMVSLVRFMQTIEVIKLLTRHRRTSGEYFLMYDAMSTAFQKISVEKDKNYEIYGV